MNIGCTLALLSAVLHHRVSSLACCLKEDLPEAHPVWQPQCPLNHWTDRWKVGGSLWLCLPLQSFPWQGALSLPALESPALDLTVSSSRQEEQCDGNARVSLLIEHVDTTMRDVCVCVCVCVSPHASTRSLLLGAQHEVCATQCRAVRVIRRAIQGRVTYKENSTGHADKCQLAQSQRHDRATAVFVCRVWPCAADCPIRLGPGARHRHLR